MVTIIRSKRKTMLCRGEGRERGGIISWIGRPSGIRTLSLVFSSTDGLKEEKQHRNGTGRRPAAKCDLLCCTRLSTIFLLGILKKKKNVQHSSTSCSGCFETMINNDVSGMFCFFKSLRVSEMLFLCPARNPSASPQSANKVSSDPSQRIQNLSLLVQQIRTYYQVRLASW